MIEDRLTNDASIQRSVRQEREKFVQQLRGRESELLQLASRVCGQAPSHFFKPDALGTHFVRGSYNVSFFIQFPDGQRCVLRIPNRPCWAYCPRRKLQSEVATMQHLSQNTTIPIPKIIAHRADQGDDPLTTFLILEFIDGRHLSPMRLEDGLPPHEKKNLFESLADVYIQLRRQEFPAIGRLEASADTGTAHVGQKMVSIEMNTLQLEGLRCFSIRDTYNDENGALQSASSYANMQLCIGYAAFLNSPNAVGKGMGLEVVRNRSVFVKHAKGWIDPALDQGPFVLVHGDLHLSNLIVDKDARIIGVLDWEWSRVVPLQYFTPPTWLSGRDTVRLALPLVWDLFRKTALADFLAIVATREMDLFGNLTLHGEWSRTVDRAEPLVANAVQNWTDVDWFVHRYMYEKQPLSADDARAFVDDDPCRALLAHIKEHDAAQHEKELVRLEEDKENAQVHESAVWTLVNKIRHMQQQSSMLGFGVAACLVMAAVWRRMI